VRRATILGTSIWFCPEWACATIVSAQSYMDAPFEDERCIVWARDA
jgi:hypothetical protein